MIILLVYSLYYYYYSVRCVHLMERLDVPNQSRDDLSDSELAPPDMY